jgi:pyruvate ferredoxin oxidoreductase gamma subunit/2-oxoisovalerate ferredoxin oxidoreductase gamma subunit
MVEIRFHGRGGQGTVVATILLAKAFFRDGYRVQSFPLFGVERRGAPVEAYLRFDRKQILVRTNVYTPDHVVVLDQTLLEAVDVSHGLKPGGWILINASSPPANPETFPSYRLAFVDATSVALKNGLGTRTHPIVNTAMMGGLARVLGMPAMVAVIEAIEKEVPSRPKSNIRAAEEAYSQVEFLESTNEGDTKKSEIRSTKSSKA